MKTKTILIILALVLLITTMGTALAQAASTQARLAVVRGKDGKLSVAKKVVSNNSSNASKPSKTATAPSKSPRGARLQANVVSLPGNDEFAVYSGPGSNYHRADNGSATVKTTSEVWSYGIEYGYALIRYNAVDGNTRFGYIEEKWLLNPAETVELQMEYKPVGINKSTSITDDPLGNAGSIMTLSAGDNVVYLAMLDDQWAFIETTANDVLPMRGFVPASALNF